MRLSILNYGSGADVTVPKHAKREDEELIASASNIVKERNFGRGGIVVAEVMHTDLPNFNNRRYRTKGLDEAVTTFYYPHFTPFLMHHETGGGGPFGGGDANLISVGTNLFSRFYRKKTETATGTASGYVKVATFVRENQMIGDNYALDALQARQLMGLSIGARVHDENYRCSICNKSLYDEECDHSPGKEYEGKRCYADVYSPMFREYSAVYTPADINALVRRVEVSDAEGGVVEEHLMDQCYGNASIAIYETVGNIYPSADVRSTGDSDTMGSTEKKETNKDTVTGETLKELAELIAKYEHKLNELEKEKDKEIVGLREELEEKDKLIATLSEALDEKTRPEEDEVEDNEDESEADEGEDNAPSEKPSDAQTDPAESEENEESSSESEVEDANESDSDIEQPMEDSEDVEDVEEDGEGEESQADADGSSEVGETVEGDPEEASQEASDDPSTDAEGEAEDGECEDSENPAEENGSEDEDTEKTYRKLLRERNSKFGILSVPSNGSKGSKGLPKKFRI